MGIMDMFRAPPAAAVPPQNPQANKGPGTSSAGEQNNSVTLEKNNQEQNNLGPDGKPKEEPNPLDSFKDLWHDTPAPDGGSGKDGKQPPKGTDYASVVKNLDFASKLPKDKVTAALQGNSDAFGEVINHAMRLGFAAQGTFADRAIAKAVKETEERIYGSLPEKLKQHSLQQTPHKNPAMKHPAIKPMIDAIRQQMATKFPEADVSELQEKAETYVSAMISEAGKSQKGSAAEEQASEADMKLKQQEAGKYDWESWATAVKPS